jgi:hypothetical protein
MVVNYDDCADVWYFNSCVEENNVHGCDGDNNSGV